VVLHELGCRLVKAARFDAAVTVLTRCLLVNPVNFQARGALGSVLHRQGRLGEARTLYEEAIRLAPNQAADCHINLGHILRDFGDLQAARVAFLDGIQLSGGNADDFNHLA
jgi:Flp pilus assembly protein TadD